MAVVSLVKLLFDEYHKTLLMISQHCFRQWLGVIRQRTITWSNVHPLVCHSLYGVTRPQWIKASFPGCQIHGDNWALLNFFDALVHFIIRPSANMMLCSWYKLIFVCLGFYYNHPITSHNIWSVMIMKLSGMILKETQAGWFSINMSLPVQGIPVAKIRCSQDGFIFIMFSSL